MQTGKRRPCPHENRRRRNPRVSDHGPIPGAVEVDRAPTRQHPPRRDRSRYDDDAEDTPRTRHPRTRTHSHAHLRTRPGEGPAAAGGPVGRLVLPRPVGRRGLTGDRTAAAGHRSPAAAAVPLLLPRAARRPRRTPRPDGHRLRRIRRRNGPAVARPRHARGPDRAPQPGRRTVGRCLRRPRALRPNLPRRGGPPRLPARGPAGSAGRHPVRRRDVRRLPRLQHPQHRDHGRLADPRRRSLAGARTRPGARPRARGGRRAATRRAQGHHPAVGGGRRGPVPRARPAGHRRPAGRRTGAAPCERAALDRGDRRHRGPGSAPSGRTRSATSCPRPAGPVAEAEGGVPGLELLRALHVQVPRSRSSIGWCGSWIRRWWPVPLLPTRSRPGR